MEIQLSADQQLQIERLITSGRYASVTDVISAGVSILAEAERQRQEIRLGVEQADRGEVISHETVFTRLKAMAVAQSSGSGE